MTSLNWLNNLRRQIVGVTRHHSAHHRSRRSARHVARIEVLETRQLLSASNSVKLTNGTNGAPATGENDQFGCALTAIGDLDGDGVNDMAVGLTNDGLGNDGFGAVDILFMNSDGTVKSITKISSGVNGGPILDGTERFGFTSVASLGDIDGDGITDLAVSASQDNTGGPSRGAVFILHLNSNGSVKSSTKIASGLNGGPTLPDNSFFGTSVAAIGDFDNDGISDMAVGCPGAVDEPTEPGAMYIVRLNADGTAKSSTRVAPGENGGPAVGDDESFGLSIASIGDLNNDGVTDLAVGSPLNGTGGELRGAVFILFMNADGTVDSNTLIASGTNGGPTLSNAVFFGSSVALMGDLDADGLPELAVGCEGDDTGGLSAGAVYLLNLNANGTVESSEKIASGLNGGPTLSEFDGFGFAISNLGDLDGDGVTDLAVAAHHDSTDEFWQGAVYVLFLNGGANSTPPVVAINGGPATFVKRHPPTTVAPALTVTDADTKPEDQVPGGRIVISINEVTNKKHTKFFDRLNLESLNAVGTVGASQTTNGRVQTTIQLSASATLAQIDDALQAITFTTAKKGLKIPTRTVQIRVFDKGNTPSNLATQTINVLKKIRS